MNIVRGSDLINLFKSLNHLNLWAKYLKAKSEKDAVKAKIIKDMIDEAP